MATPCFYHPELTTQCKLVELIPSESAHALQSRRLKSGNAVRLINGAGLIADAKISEVKKKSVTVEIVHVERVEAPSQAICVAVAMPKGDRQKVMVDMLAQLGVSKIIPILTQYSVSSLKSSQLDKLQRVAVEASKQSQNPWLMQIEQPIELAEAMTIEAQKFYAEQFGQPLARLKQDSSNALIFIGPEGGFCEQEIAEFKRMGALPITFADYILRTETAAVVAASLLLNNR